MKINIDTLVTHLQLAFYFHPTPIKPEERAKFICKWLRRKRKDFDKNASAVAAAIIAGENIKEPEGKFNSAEFQYDTYAILLLGKKRVHPSTLPLPSEWLQQVAEAMAVELQADLYKEL